MATLSQINLMGLFIDPVIPLTVFLGGALASQVISNVPATVRG